VIHSIYPLTDRVVDWGMQIRLKPDVYNWICQIAGYSDPRFWSEPEYLEHALLCKNSSRNCPIDHSSQDEPWGWALQPIKTEGHRTQFSFVDQKAAMLFKLTWYSA